MKSSVGRSGPHRGGADPRRHRRGFVWRRSGSPAANPFVRRCATGLPGATNASSISRCIRFATSWAKCASSTRPDSTPQTALAALAPYADSPVELLSRLDAFVATSATTDFATVCYGVLDPSTGTFEYASAGHPPILLVPPGGEPWWLDEAQSPPLYGDDERLRPQATVTIAPGSLIVCYSDGLIERR